MAVDFPPTGEADFEICSPPFTQVLGCFHFSFDARSMTEVASFRIMNQEYDLKDLLQ